MLAEAGQPSCGIPHCPDPRGDCGSAAAATMVNAAFLRVFLAFQCRQRTSRTLSTLRAETGPPARSPSADPYAFIVFAAEANH